MAHLRRKDRYQSGDVAVSRRVIATYPTYVQAEDDVARLVALGVRREELTIVAEEHRLRGETASRSDAWRSVVPGLVAGVITGAVFGFLFGLLSWVDPLISGRVLAFYGAVFGAAVGALLGFAGYRLSDGNGIQSMGRLEAGGYAVLAAEPVADDAARLVRTLHRPRAVH